MDSNERRIIDDLFGRLHEAERRLGPRDAEAERHIGDHVRRLPAAPYLMAQTIVMQEQALETAQARIDDLERQLRERPSGGRFLGGMLGGRQPAARPAASSWGRGRSAAAGPWGGAGAAPHQRQGGGGFLAGAAQTAMGVAGGVLLGSILADALGGGGEAAAGESTDQADDPAADDLPADDGFLGDEDF